MKRLMPKGLAVLGAASLLVSAAGTAHAADQLIYDGDLLDADFGATGFNSEDMSFGDVCPGTTVAASYPKSAKLAVRNRGGDATEQNAFNNSAVVTFAVDEVTNPAIGGMIAASIPATGNQVTMPSNWQSLADGAKSSTVTSSVNLSVPSGAATGSRTATVKYKASGPGSHSSGTVNRDNTMSVSWNVLSATSTACAPLDNTPPVVTPAVAGTQGNNGWYTSNVGLSWSVTDGQSAISSQSGCSAVNVTLDQSATTYTCSATSAGGTTTETVSIKRDATAPTVTPDSVTDATWRNTSLAQGFTASDAGSGLANSADSTFTLTASDESASASTPTVVSKTVTDVAGNRTIRTVSAKIDVTGPEILGGDVTDTTWRNSDLTQRFEASDLLSGLAVATDATFSLTASVESKKDAQGNILPTVVSETIADAVGNKTTRTLSARIDRTPPTVTCGTASVYILNQSNPADVMATVGDGLSGPAAASATEVPDVTSLGKKTVSIIGYDNAGNSASASCTYYVRAVLTAGNSALDGGASLSRVKAGSAIPLKFRLTDANGAPVTTVSTYSMTVANLACDAGSTPDLAAESAAGASGLQNLGDGYYQINWKSPTSYANSCKTLTVGLGEATGETSGTGRFHFVK